MTSPQVDLNKAAKCVDIITLKLLASLSSLYEIQNCGDIWPNLQRFINQFMKEGGIKTWKEIMTGVHQLVCMVSS